MLEIIGLGMVGLGHLVDRGSVVRQGRGPVAYPAKPPPNASAAHSLLLAQRAPEALARGVVAHAGSAAHDEPQSASAASRARDRPVKKAMPWGMPSALES